MNAEVAAVRHFHPRSSDHRPETFARLLYDGEAVYVRFDVRDRYVVCAHTEAQSRVCEDSCVEWFVQPKPGKGYFNFETNCGGTMLLYYVEDPTRVDGDFKKRTAVAREWIDRIAVRHTLPRVVLPERGESTDWRVEYAVPFALFEDYVGALGEMSGQRWRGNLYKCADGSSHPHWAAWTPIGEELNFHQPWFFGTFVLD